MATIMSLNSEASGKPKVQPNQVNSKPGDRDIPHSLIKSAVMPPQKNDSKAEIIKKEKAP